MMSPVSDIADRKDEAGAFGERIMALADRLASWSEAAEKLTCTYLSSAHLTVAKELAILMNKAGLAVEIDAVKNVIGRYKSTNIGARTVIIGSHYDTVRDAGKYDGRLGVLAGLVVAEHIVRNGISLPFNLEVIAFSEEEGVRFPTSYIGSGAVSGRFAVQQLEMRDAEGTSLADALHQHGTDLKMISALARKKGDIAAYLEVHIEQGPVLLETSLPLGVVTEIAGNTRCIATITGVAGHAGTVPMALRHDAVTAAAEMILLVERRCQVPGLLGTVGRFEVPGGAVNSVPGRCEFSVDIRSGNDAMRKAAVADIISDMKRIADRRGVKVAIAPSLDEAAVPCSPHLQDVFAAAIARAGLPVRRLPSGAGHDAVMFDQLTDIGMLFVRCGNGGVSHSPREIINEEDADIAARVLLDALIHLQV